MWKEDQSKSIICDELTSISHNSLAIQIFCCKIAIVEKIK